MLEQLKIDNLNKKVEALSELVFALYLVQDSVAQFRLDKQYPFFKEMRKKLNNNQ